MNIIFFSKREGLARQLNLAHPVTLGVVAALVLGILGTAFALGMQLGQGSGGRLAHGESARWTQILAEQKHQIAELKERMNEREQEVRVVPRTDEMMFVSLLCSTRTVWINHHNFAPTLA